MASVSGSSSTTSSNYYLLNTGTNSSLQVSGLASGIDVDSIVNKLMQAESVPLDSMNQKLQLLEWKRDDYRSMSTLLSNLLTTVNSMALQSNYAKSATVSDPTKLTVTPATGAGTATYTISNASLATVASTYSSASIASTTTGNVFDPSKPLIEQAANLDQAFTWDTNTVTDETKNVTADGTVFQLTNGAVLTAGASVSVTPSEGGSVDYTVVTSKDALDTTDPTKHQVYIDSTTGQMTFNQSIGKGSTIKANYTYQTVNFNMTTYGTDGKAITTNLDMNGSLSLNSMLQRLNVSGAGVNAFYDSATNQVAISTANTGNYNVNGNEMTFNSNFMTNVLKLNGTEQGGQDATFTLNGMDTSRHSNTFTVNNTTFTLNETIPSTQTVSVGINTDTDGVFNQIKSFVDQYNDTIKQINDMTSVAPNRDYPPLTSAQKAQMSDNDITNWNEKAKQGTLYNDTILNSVLSKMRQNIYGAVSGISGGAYSQLAQMGITTSSDYTDHGKLIIDESKLKSAIAANPDSVMKMFTNGNSSSSDVSSQGIAKRLYNTLTNAVSQIKEQAGTTALVNDQFYIGRSINDLTDEISDFQDHLKTLQTRYYNQFSAMEQAIAQANSQASYLQNTFS